MILIKKLNKMMISIKFINNWLKKMMIGKLISISIKYYKLIKEYQKILVITIFKKVILLNKFIDFRVIIYKFDT